MLKSTRNSERLDMAGSPTVTFLASCDTFWGRGNPTLTSLLGGWQEGGKRVTSVKRYCTTGSMPTYVIDIPGHS
jgi:hypothetical protein